MLTYADVKLDTTARHMTLALAQDSTRTMTFAYSTPDTNHPELIGLAGADSLRMTLERIGPHGMLLVDRGFHLVNESPYNR
ncbi:MAG TPA: hypothetical protein VFJ96_06340 [Gemmatimonadaceae bacterium]|nr:hypothetical protein [Gemmatimonadaceae bacterium]